MDAPDDSIGHEATAIRDPLIGVTVLGYQLIRTIGVGGMGKVYEAEEKNIGRRAAVKVLLPEVAENPEFVARLKAEARAANAARHRGIIDIFGFSELPDGRHAIVMEFLEGRPLDEELLRLSREGRRLPVVKAIDVLDQVAAVLQAAHDAGVTHRDLKPSNIFLCDTRDGSTVVKVLDFGVAKFEGLTNSPRTATNIVMGTPSYMAPEQAAGEHAAPSMDLYALGVIAFELFTGRLPFEHPGVMQLLLAHQQTPPPVPSSLVPGTSKLVDDFVLKLLAKQPAARFPNGAEVRAALAKLRKVLGDVEATATQPALEVKTLRVPVQTLDTGAAQAAVRRSPLPFIGLGVGALVVVIAAVALWPSSAPPANVAPPPPAVTPPAPVAVAAPPPPPVPDPPTPPPVDVPTPALTPAPAPPEITQAPEPPKVAKHQPDSRRAALARRLTALEARLANAARAGASVALEQQQAQSLQRALKSKPDAKTLEQIEVALERLEQENR